jgi:hypothetical protein
LHRTQLSGEGFEAIGEVLALGPVEGEFVVVFGGDPQGTIDEALVPEQFGAQKVERSVL